MMLLPRNGKESHVSHNMAWYRDSRSCAPAFANCWPALTARQFEVPPKPFRARSPSVLYNVPTACPGPRNEDPTMSRSRDSGTPSKQKVPRIGAAEAAKVLEQCRKTLDAYRELLRNVRHLGLGQLLAQLDDKVLKLAIQPDPWGERTRAFLLSEIAPALSGQDGREVAVPVEDIVEAAKVIMPCLLLEIGRRQEHIQVEFPPNPSDPESCLKFRVGPSHPVHSLNIAQITQLLSVADEALVGLCYFGDPESRARLEAELSLTGAATPRETAN